MARVTKKAEVRREELLDVAFDLCRSHGFEAMSVEQVTRTAGVAKGTFYHYFASKDALLEQLVRRLGDGLFDHLCLAASGVQGSGAERLRALMDAAGGYKLTQPDLAYASFLYSDENRDLRHRLFDAWRKRARQLLLPEIVQGAADGSLAVADAEGAADIVLLLWFDAADQLWERALAVRDRDRFIHVMVSGASTIYQAQERILGVPAGTFVATSPRPEHLDLVGQLYDSLDRSER